MGTQLSKLVQPWISKDRAGLQDVYLITCAVISLGRLTLRAHHVWTSRPSVPQKTRRCRLPLPTLPPRVGASVDLGNDKKRVTLCAITGFMHSTGQARRDQKTSRTQDTHMQAGNAQISGSARRIRAEDREL